MRFTRWTNPSLPQTLSIAVILLYLNGVFSLLSTVGVFSSNYELVPYVFTIAPSGSAVTLSAFLGGLAYLFAGLAIANSQKLGWKVGVAVAAGAVALPVIVWLNGNVSIGGGFIISFIFDVALLVALVHPQSRDHQRIWFED
ncbi:MAG: hypothetical protein JWM47_296 [Acidimicrobiales bacterium]|nr:hypothetical protein [Acidimicrobiales bacterium]